MPSPQLCILCERLAEPGEVICSQCSEQVEDEYGDTTDDISSRDMLPEEIGDDWE